MTANSDGERIASLEANMHNIEKKVDEGFANLAKQVNDLAVSIVARNAVVDARFVSRDDYDIRMQAVEKQIGTRWINNTLSAVLGAILTGLISLIVYLLTTR